MNKPKDLKTKSVSPKKGTDQPHDLDELRTFTRAIFDGELQRHFEDFLHGTVKVKGRPTSDEISSVSLRELTRYENPVIQYVEEQYGVYNPDEIAISTYDMMKRDPTISAGLAFIKLPILALPWRIECVNPKIKAFTENAVKRVWRRLARSMLTAVEYGFASHEKVYDLKKVKVKKRNPDGSYEIQFDGMALLYKRFKCHYPDSIEIEFDYHENYAGITQLQRGGKEVYLPPRKSFLFTHEEEFGDLFGRSRLKPAYKYWYWKEVLYQFMLMYYERRGSPPVIVTAPPGTSKDSAGNRIPNIDRALELGSSLLNNSIAAIPYEAHKDTKENQWNVSYLSDEKRGEMFLSAINHIDAAILRALWIPERVLTQQSGSGGGYSMATVHADLFLMAELGLISDIESAVDEQILPVLVEANFKPEDREPCYFKMDSLDWNRKIALKEIFITMLRNIDTIVKAGGRPLQIPSISQMAQILQIPLEDFEQEVVFDGDNEDNDSEMGKQSPVKNRTSFPGSREADRRIVTPGGKRAEQMRAKLQEVLDDMGVEDIYSPRQNEDGTVPVPERIRVDIIKKAQTEEGLNEVKKGLARLKVWSGDELIQNFNYLGFWEIARVIEYMPDHYVEILNEAMNRTLSEDEDE